MKRTFYTAADVRRFVKEEGKSELVLGPRDVITAQAVDTAADLGLRLINHDATPAWSTARPKAADAPPTAHSELTRDELVALITRVVTEVLREMGRA